MIEDGAVYRIRKHLAEKKAGYIDTAMNGHCDNMQEYSACCARYQQIDEILSDIDEIMKELNNV